MQSIGFLYILSVDCIYNLHFVNSIGHEKKAAELPAILPQKALLIISIKVTFKNMLVICSNFL